jgi:hypothetical protein
MSFSDLRLACHDTIVATLLFTPEGESVRGKYDIAMTLGTLERVAEVPSPVKTAGCL